MATTDQATILAVFDEGGQAEVALDRLWHAGFRREQIGIVKPGRIDEAKTPAGEVEHAAARGAATGAVAGGTLGAITGALLTGFIPGIGPVVAGGLLTGLVAGAAAGAAGGAYLGPFIGMGLSEDEARRYEGNIQAGRTVVAVRPGDQHDKAVEILEHYGAHTIRHAAGEVVGKAP